jgi:excisionase family DNA binding protein
MEPLTFDGLPQAVSLLQDKLNIIEQLLRERNIQAQDSDELLTIAEAAKLLNLSVPTLYGKVSKQEIPVNKQGKRLYFYKSELASWIKTGRQKTAAEIRKEAEQYLTSKRRGSNC